MDATLPAGLTTRPLERTDSRAVFELIARQEQADIGTVEIEEADIIGDWNRPSHDLAAASIGVFDGETLVAYGELMGADRSDAAVEPSYRGRGIGTWLAGWLRETARRRGATVLGMPVPIGSPGDRLLESLGYHVRWRSWVLQLPEGRLISHRDLPSGYAVREATAAEHRAVRTVLEDAFLEWSVREREPFDDFTASVLGRPGYQPWNMRVVADAAGAVVGAALVFVSGDTAYIARLGVRKDERNRGLAQALLVDAFAAAREHGATVSELSTDSRTGALGLYEKVGMVTTMEWVNRAVQI
jgi:GNAT superfamily N-acetyltransferase